MTQMMKLMKAVAHAAGCGAYSIRLVLAVDSAHSPTTRPGGCVGQPVWSISLSLSLPHALGCPAPPPPRRAAHHAAPFLARPQRQATATRFASRCCLQVGV